MLVSVFWNDLTDADREALLAIGVAKRFPVGANLFRNGDRPTHALVIRSGLVKLTRSSATGHGILIELRGPGIVLGELGAVSGEARTATADVVEPVDGIIIPADAFRRLLRENNSLAYAMLESVVEKLQQATSRRLEASTGDALARLCGRLVELAADQEPDADGVIEVRSPLTQQELAEWIGVSRDAVVLALRTIRKRGWVETGRRTIRILDLEALQATIVE